MLTAVPHSIHIHFAQRKYFTRPGHCHFHEASYHVRPTRDVKYLVELKHPGYHVARVRAEHLQCRRRVVGYVDDDVMQSIGCWVT